MYGNALAGGYKAKDIVSKDGVAAFGHLKLHIVQLVVYHKIISCRGGNALAQSGLALLRLHLLLGLSLLFAPLVLCLALIQIALNLRGIQAAVVNGNEEVSYGLVFEGL